MFHSYEQVRLLAVKTISSTISLFLLATRHGSEPVLLGEDSSDRFRSRWVDSFVSLSLCEKRQRLTSRQYPCSKYLQGFPDRQGFLSSCTFHNHVTSTAHQEYIWLKSINLSYHIWTNIISRLMSVLRPSILCDERKRT